MAGTSTGERRIKVLVLGGIGSGKSTVARVFASLGATVIEADRIGHQVLEPDGAAYGEVAERWPAVADGSRIDRAALARIVFTDVDQLRELEAITHPLIRGEILRRVEAVSPVPVVVELPLLAMELGEGWVRVVVDAPSRERILRSVARGMDERDVVARVDAQPERNEWLARADHIIINGGTLEELEAAAVDVWETISANAPPE
jgi:dephospho-CoA kinase